MAENGWDWHTSVVTYTKMTTQKMASDFMPSVLHGTGHILDQKPCKILKI